MGPGMTFTIGKYLDYQTAILWISMILPGKNLIKVDLVKPKLTVGMVTLNLSFSKTLLFKYWFLSSSIPGALRLPHGADQSIIAWADHLQEWLCTKKKCRWEFLLVGLC